MPAVELVIYYNYGTEGIKRLARQTPFQLNEQFSVEEADGDENSPLPTLELIVESLRPASSAKNFWWVDGYCIGDGDKITSFEGSFHSTIGVGLIYMATRRPLNHGPFRKES